MRTAGAVVVLSLFCVSEALGASATATASATVIKPLAVSTTTALQFGAFSTLTGGTLTVDGSGTLSTSGDVAPSSSQSVAPARFTLAGEAGATYAVTLPGSAELSHESAEATTLTIGAFTSHSSSPLALDSSGEAELAVGATLTIPASAALGTYTGSFEILVEYN